MSPAYLGQIVAQEFQDYKVLGDKTIKSVEHSGFIQSALKPAKT